jgi:hypothetical protein
LRLPLWRTRQYYSRVLLLGSAVAAAAAAAAAAAVTADVAVRARVVDLCSSSLSLLEHFRWLLVARIFALLHLILYFSMPDCSLACL